MVGGMRSKIDLFALPMAVLLVSTQVALAQGPSGGNGAVASIPASVVRGQQEGPGLLSILTDSTTPTRNLSSTSRRPIRLDAPPSPVDR